MLDWKKLLNTERRRLTQKQLGDQRTEFERDYDRVIFSSSFRRLKDKTQVYPLNHDDFVRTRLSHSLEVSSFGRFFGIDIVRSLKENGIDDLYSKHDYIEAKISSIIATACLLHDIGNPPFGHFGEKSIQTFFEKYFQKNKTSLNERQKLDFVNFEGNAQALRVVTYLQALDDDKGLNLTYGTLASMIKYPCRSNEIKKDKKKQHSKFGFFSSEENIFQEIQEQTGLNGERHPLVYLMEAADDIAFSTVDVEDALKRRCVSNDIFIEYMTQSLKNYPHFLQKLEKIKVDQAKYYQQGWGDEGSYRIAIQKFRIDISGIMFRACVKEFCSNYKDIMNCNYTEALIENSDAKILYKTLTGFARKYVYIHPEIIEVEILGEKVIHGLLELFVDAIQDDTRDDNKILNGKLYNLISPSLKNLMTIYGNVKDEYQRLQMATDFISGMTDSYALNLYQKLHGVKHGYF